MVEVRIVKVEVPRLARPSIFTLKCRGRAQPSTLRIIEHASSTFETEFT